jgi:hypothetical protein
MGEVVRAEHNRSSVGARSSDQSKLAGGKSGQTFETVVIYLEASPA